MTGSTLKCDAVVPAMDWEWVHTQLTLAAWYLDAAASTVRPTVGGAQLRQAQQAYVAAQSALERPGLNDDERRHLRERLQELSARLLTLELGRG